MPISPDTRLGRYKILALLGVGGMGEVCLAQDVQLGRRVALKILPADVAADQDRMNRFVQEAQAASALNHPNVLTVHEIGESEGTHFIATEFVDGETLRQRMRRERLTLEEALDIGAQTAAALAAAHSAGIVHRDIKPENIMLRRDRLVKVLDFGLAKLTDTRKPIDVDMEASTQFNIYTTPGALLGTTQYMSPEQARGLVVDARSDIFSLGSVIYEMITGTMSFNGATRTDIIIAIVQQEPLPLAHYAPEVPAELQRIVSKALRKERDERYQPIKDLMLDLKSLKDELKLQRLAQSGGYTANGKTDSVLRGEAATAERAAVSTKEINAETLATARSEHTWLARVASSKALLAALIVLLLGAFGLFAWKQLNETATSENAVTSFATKQLVSWKSDLGENLDSLAKFSRDGKFIAYASSKNGNLDIWIKQIADGEPFVVPGTRDEWRDDSPLWSPDGQQIAFLSDRSKQYGIWVIPSLGGTPTFVKQRVKNNL